MADSFLSGFAATTAAFGFAGWWSLIPGVIGGLAGGFLGNHAENEEKKLRINQLDNEIELLNDDLSNLLSNEKTEESNYNRQINNTQNVADMNAAFASQTMPTANKQAYEEANNLRVQAEQAIGSATTNLANTGFRNTGTTERLIGQTSDMATAQADNGLERARLSIAQGYMGHANQFLNANERISQYHSAIVALNKRTDQEEERINKEIDYKREERWDLKGDLGLLTDEDTTEMKSGKFLAEDGSVKYKNDDDWTNFLEWLF